MGGVGGSEFIKTRDTQTRHAQPWHVPIDVLNCLSVEAVDHDMAWTRANTARHGVETDRHKTENRTGRVEY